MSQSKTVWLAIGLIFIATLLAGLPAIVMSFQEWVQ